MLRRLLSTTNALEAKPDDGHGNGCAYPQVDILTVGDFGDCGGGNR
jgi:hypothetical protein